MILHKEDLTIIRKHPNGMWQAEGETEQYDTLNGVAHIAEIAIFDCDGHLVMELSQHFTTQQIHEMVDEINRFHGIGVQEGQLDKMIEIKKALGVKE